MFDERDWGAFLSEELKSRVVVRFGRARQRVLEARYDRPSPDGTPVMNVRLSSFFAEAPVEVRAAVAQWLRVGRRARKASALLDAWIEESVEKLPPARPRRRALRPRGQHHDLSALLAELSDSIAQLPPIETLPQVTWGRRTGVRARRSLQLGCYVATDNLIRVHPVLDQAFVPDWFVRYVLFHELLHAALPAERGQTGRAVHHGTEFRRLEQRYPDYARAVAWLESRLPKLLRSTKRLAKTGQGELEPTGAAQPAPTRRAARSTEPRPSPGWLFPFLD